MKIYVKYVTKYPFSSLCIVLIWILCFFSPPHTPLDNVALMDKWVHIIMYAGTCSVIWVEYLRNKRNGNGKKFDINGWHVFIWTWLFPVIMSGLIEIMQAYCTGGRRNGDWLDFAANGIGATLAAIAGTIITVSATKRHDNKKGA